MRKFTDPYWLVLLAFICSAVMSSTLTIKNLRLEIELAETKTALEDTFTLASCDIYDTPAPR